MKKRKNKRPRPGVVVERAPETEKPGSSVDGNVGDSGGDPAGDSAVETLAESSSVAGAIPTAEVTGHDATATAIDVTIVDAEMRAADSEAAGERTAVDVTATVLASPDGSASDGDEGAPEDTAVEIADAALEILGEEESGAVAAAAETVGPADAEAGSVEDLAGAGEGAGEGAGAGGADEPLPDVEGSRLESIIESLLFAADRPLVLSDLKRLLGSRDGKRITEALESLRERRADSGIHLVSVAGGWQLRTHPANGAWVAKLVAGRPPRLSRAMMETLSIVAYRQPITRPEIDEIRGVDCGPVLRTLLDRSLIRVIGKKEEVGRPMLYGTTPEFLKVFSLRDLTDLPTLREFHELGADDRAKVDASSDVGGDAVSVGAGQGEGQAQGQGEIKNEGAGSKPAGDASGAADAPGHSEGLAASRPAPDPLYGIPAGTLSDFDPDEEDALMEALDHATEAAGRASLSVSQPDAAAAEADADIASASTSAETGED